MPLMQDNESKFRLFLGDIGMFSYHLVNWNSLSNEIINYIRLM